MRALRIMFFLLALAVTSGPLMAEAVAGARFYQIRLKDAEEAVSAALVAEGVGERVAARIIGRPEGALYESDNPLQVAVKTLTYDPDKGKWSANLMFVSGEEVLSAMPVSGRFEFLKEIPVLNLRHRNGEVLEEKDVTMKEFPASRIRPGTVTELADIVGRMPRRMISPGRPVREDELVAPAVVKKGAQVRISYRTGAMQLETAGQAMADGGIGDLIPVENIDSKVVVQGIVENERQVRVTSIARSEDNRKER